MPNGLTDYHRKRDFRRTQEPRGRKAQQEGFRYLIQKHAASHLHYDFRLELGGVLKSWAVPKGPNLDPQKKSLAVQVEDHPLQYGDFEGVIPAGQYGGGTVMLWDRGTWEPLGDPRVDYGRGRLTFRLHGEKLTGKWSLVRMHGDAGGGGKNWLLIHHKDSETGRVDSKFLERESRSVASRRSMEQIASAADRQWSSQGKRVAKKKAPSAKLSGARRAPFPRAFHPELATLVKAVPSEDNWLYEIKYDGYRLIAFVKNGRVLLTSRNGLDWTKTFPAIAEAIGALGVQTAIFDGELVALDEKHQANFQRLQNALLKEQRTGFTYYLFDLPYLNGFDLTASPLAERKALLEKVVGKSPDSRQVLQYSNHLMEQGETIYRNACRLHLEGIIAKRADSPYTQRRTRDWIKLKCERRQEFLIIGYTPPGGGRLGFGSLLLGYYNEKHQLVYAGNVGTGFSHQMLEFLTKKLKALAQKQSPLDDPSRASRKAQWVKPRLIAEVSFTEWTKDGSLRHPAFHGLRNDKKPGEITREVPKELPAQSRSWRSHSKKERHPDRDETTVGGVKITHPERILYPEQKITKRDLASYYERIADWILPHIIERPLSIVRCPEGREKECFFQKHLTHSFPEAIDAVKIREKDGSRSPYIMIHDLKGLISLVQMGALEIHPWGCLQDDIEHPDRMILDIDPGPDVKWAQLSKTALLIRDVLTAVGLQSFLRTTGGKGLHVVVPLKPRATWQEVGDFCKTIADVLVHSNPDQYVSVMTKKKRTGKMFIDYLRNRRGATAIASYSTRSRPNAPVATPLDWKELTAKLNPQRFTVETVPNRLAKTRHIDPWQDFFQIKQVLTASMSQRLKHQ